MDSITDDMAIDNNQELEVQEEEVLAFNEETIETTIETIVEDVDVVEESVETQDEVSDVSDTNEEVAEVNSANNEDNVNLNSSDASSTAAAANDEGSSEDDVGIAEKVESSEDTKKPDNDDSSSGEEKEAKGDSSKVSDKDSEDTITAKIKPSEEVPVKLPGEDMGEDAAQDIADIFGDSGDEDDEFTGFDNEDGGDKKKRKVIMSDSDSDSEDGETETKEPVQAQVSEEPKETEENEDSEDDVEQPGGMVYDFDVIMERKKAQRKKRGRRDGGTTISDADDIVNRLMHEMKSASENDREAIQKKQPALYKLKMLPRLLQHLNRQDMKESLIEGGIFSGIADWLTPIQKYVLPHLSIRRQLLKALSDLPLVSAETLKSSNVGKAVMFIYKHPKEIRANKEIAGRLIQKWSRPLFGLNDNFKSMSRSDREQRDLEQFPPSKKQKTSEAGASSSTDLNGNSLDQGEERGTLRPGDKGFVMRARVPMPSNKDYVIRPKWNVGSEGGEDGGMTSASYMNKSKAKKDTRLDKHIKSFAEKKRRSKLQRAVNISLQGNKMKL